MTGTLRDLRPNELKSVYARVKRDFPPIEHPPLCSMRRYLAKGSLHGSIYESDGVDAGYAFLLTAPGTLSRMLFLYAVEPQLRGQGVGGAFLEALAAQQADCSGLYAEVEIPALAQTPQDRLQREKRIAFYEKHGFCRIMGLEYILYGLKMHIFYRPLTRTGVPDASTAAQELRTLNNGIFYRWERSLLRMRTE